MKVKIQSDFPELEGAEEIFEGTQRLTPATFKKFKTLLEKERFYILYVRAKRKALPKPPVHRPVPMKVPVEVYGSGAEEMGEYDIIFRVARD